MKVGGERERVFEDFWFPEIDGCCRERTTMEKEKKIKKGKPKSFTSATPSRASMISRSESINPGAAVSAAFCRLRSASARAAEVDELSIIVAEVPSPPMAVESIARTSPGVRGWRGWC